MACRSGCPTQNHSSWGACARASRLQIGDVRGRDRNKDWDSELDEFQSAVEQGVVPRGTTRNHTRAALDYANLTGEPLK